MNRGAGEEGVFPGPLIFRGNPVTRLTGTADAMGETAMKNQLSNTEATAFQEVLTRLVDSIAGFRMAADFSTDPAFIRLCTRTADRRDALVEELAAIVADCGAEPSLEGSREAAVHRAWIRLVCQIHPKFRDRLRAECERGEREFRRTLDARNLPAARNERTGTLLAELREGVEVTLDALRREKVPTSRASGSGLAAA